MATANVEGLSIAFEVIGEGRPWGITLCVGWPKLAPVLVDWSGEALA